MALDLNDKSGNGNNLTNVNTVADITTSLPFAASTHAAGFTTASSQRLEASDSTSLHPSTKYTLETWVKFSSLPASGGAMYLINKSSDNNAGGFYMSLYNNAGTYWLYGDANNTGSFVLYHVTVTPSTGTWYHYAITCDVTLGAGLKMEFFVNGSSVGNGTAQFDNAIGTIATTTLPLTLGCNIQSDNTTRGAFLDGQLDDVRYWKDTVRTATQISNNYQSLLTGTETGLGAYYPFEALPVATTGGTLLFMGV